MSQDGYGIGKKYVIERRYGRWRYIESQVVEEASNDAITVQYQDGIYGLRRSPEVTTTSGSPYVCMGTAPLAGGRGAHGAQWDRRCRFRAAKSRRTTPARYVRLAVE